jgi:hypothetical protein
VALVTWVSRCPGRPLGGAIVELAPSRWEGARALDEAGAASASWAHQAPERGRTGRTVWMRDCLGRAGDG